jgi:hypothetical protein
MPSRDCGTTAHRALQTSAKRSPDSHRASVCRHRMWTALSRLTSSICLSPSFVDGVGAAPNGRTWQHFFQCLSWSRAESRTNVLAIFVHDSALCVANLLSVRVCLFRRVNPIDSTHVQESSDASAYAARARARTISPAVLSACFHSSSTACSARSNASACAALSVSMA